MQFIDFRQVRKSEAQTKKQIKADHNQVKEKNHGKS